MLPLLLQIEAICLSLGARPAKAKPCTFSKNGENFALMTSFDLENVDRRSHNLHRREFLGGLTYPPSLVFLTFLGVEIADTLLPSRARNSQTLSSASVNFTLVLIPISLQIVFSAELPVIPTPTSFSIGAFYAGVGAGQQLLTYFHIFPCLLLSRPHIYPCLLINHQHLS